jgi:hypothetical protein
MSIQFHGDKELATEVKRVIPELTALVTTQSALTATLTPLTHTAPGTPDYAIQALTVTTPYGFVSSDEGNTVLKVIANLQTRVSELEAALQAVGILA